jgi:putative transposase
MPNHFHLLVKQHTEVAIAKFMQCLTNSYVRYFNTKYERVGPLFQGKYKGVLIETDAQLLHVTRYIHRNCLELSQVGSRGRSNLHKQLLSYSYSSYAEYLGKRNTSWVRSQEILEFFKTAQKSSLKDVLSYQSFVEDYNVDFRDYLGGLALG